MSTENGIGPFADLNHLDEESREAMATARENHARVAALLSGSARLTVRKADLDRVRPIRWLWNRRLPLGYLSLMLGAEGIGKGTALAWIIAQATRGHLEGDLFGKPTSALVIGDEDAFDSVWVPRLHAAGADLDRVHTLQEGEEEAALDIARDASSLGKLVSDHGYGLVVIDALLDVLGVDVDDWRSKSVRGSIRPIRRMARETETTILGSLHPNKGARTTFRDLISGSHAFNAVSRSSLYLAPHPDDSERRVLVRGKGNLSKAPQSFEFSIESMALKINGYEMTVPVLDGELDGELTTDDLLKPDRPAPVRDGLVDQIDRLGKPGIITRAEIAKALGRKSDDRSVGRALDQLELDGVWEKAGRGRWRCVRFGIGTYIEVPMTKEASGVRA